MPDALNRLSCQFAFVALAAFMASTPAHADGPDQGAPPAAGFIGSTGCSARACHGSMTAENGGVLRNEYTVWLTRDRHSDAYASLYKPLAKQIAQRRGQKAAHEDAACLACHAPAVANQLSGNVQVDLHEGVGCEACHGPAGSWIGLHTGPNWRDHSPQQKAKQGFASLTNATEVASRCVSCHVGARRLQPVDRDVTHDMIAAGHPRLMFEFSSYLAHMPRHWTEKTNTSFTGSSEKAWLSGQLASLHSAVQLTVDRAAGQRKEWPDLTEFDCFSCHHALQPEGANRTLDVRKAQGAGDMGPMVYQIWYRAVPLRLAEVQGSQCPAGLATALSQLDHVMSRARPRATEVIEAGRPVISALEQWQAATLAGAEVSPRQMLAKFCRSAAARPINRWDEAEQVYLGFSALGRDDGDQLSVLGLSKLSELLGPGPNQCGRPYDPAPIRAEISRIADLVSPPQR
jgi:hypothetical protein